MYLDVLGDDLPVGTTIVGLATRSEVVLALNPSNFRRITEGIAFEVWMEVFLKLVSVALVSSDGMGDFGFQLSVAICLVTSCTIALARPYAQPQAHYGPLPRTSNLYHLISSQLIKTS